MPITHISVSDFEKSKSWPFEEARRILEKLKGEKPKKGYALFQTGYGPSGLPHIGTFGEVARTTMVMHAFSLLSDIPTRLFCFSDDMDGLRKVPDNIPNKDMVREYLNKPLTQVPDPFELYPSFGHHNNAMLMKFLDSFGFQYEFQSSTDWYTSGQFDETLRLVLQNYQPIMDIMLPSLRDERRATYSPFLPICPHTGHVLQVPMVELHPERDTIVYKDPETGKLTEVLITGGHCKLQWKVDWGMRWRAFEVDYEMSGKDLIDSVKLSSQICKVLGGEPPVSLTYELFLDELGQKISKSKGNGLTIDDWLTYAPSESLAYYMYQAPKRAKRLYFDVIPKAVDEYLSHLEKFETQEGEARLDNPAFHIHSGNPPKEKVPVSFGLLLNLASVCNAHDPEVLWGFVKKYAPSASVETMPMLSRLIAFAVKYYENFILPQKAYRQPTEQETKALSDLREALENLDDQAPTEDIQGAVFEVGKRHNYEELRTWFGVLYEVLLGQKEGPRMGTFIKVYGRDNFINLINEKCG
jgi:lysyl-tRNA synthetase class 1